MIKLFKTRWFIPLIMIISIAIILGLSGVSFARYYNEKTNQETTGVAKFIINEKIYSSINNRYEAEADFSTYQSLQPGDKLKYRIEVENCSEVTVDYTIQITSTGNLPLYINETKLSSDVISISNVIESEHTIEVIVEIVWPSEYSSINNCGMIDIISFTFIAEQKL